MSEDKELRFPGDELVTVEEFTAGEGTYEEEGLIRASVVGKTRVDEKNKTIEVHSENYPPIMRMGEEVIGVIAGVRSSMVMVDIVSVVGRGEREVANRDEGTIHISKISNDFVSEITNCFKNRDIIKAKVIQINPSLQLTTAGKDLGVIQAYCSRCREKLIRVDRKLKCPSCLNMEQRELSALYGTGKLF